MVDTAILRAGISDSVIWVIFCVLPGLLLPINF